MDTDCIDQRKFLNLLDTSNLAQMLYTGHILDLILSPSDSSFVSNVTVGEMVSDHALAADLYDQYISDLGGVLDRHAPLICRRAKKDQLDGCPIHIVGPNLSGVNLSACGVRICLS